MTQVKFMAKKTTPRTAEMTVTPMVMKRCHLSWGPKMRSMKTAREILIVTAVAMNNFANGDSIAVEVVPLKAGANVRQRH